MPVPAQYHTDPQFALMYDVCVVPGLRNLIAFAKTPTATERKDFQHIMFLAAYYFRMGNNDFAEKIGMSSASVHKYVHGKSAPPRVARKSILKDLVLRLQEQIPA